MPFDSTTVIPDDWSAHHQAAAAGGMNAEVTIGTKGTTTYDPETDDTTVTWSQEYAGPARIQALNDARQADVAGQQVSGRAYLVQLDARQTGEATLEPAMRVHVSACANDAQLVGNDLWLVDVQMGSERFTRDLVCSDNESDAPAAVA